MLSLKESFRYQKFLNGLMECACRSIRDREHSLTTTETHKKSAMNPDAKDEVIEVASEAEFICNDDVIDFILWLIEEKERLSKAISESKAKSEFDIDASVETNKFRHCAEQAINEMLMYKPTTKKLKGTDYKFNAEGNQTPYYYDVEITTKEAYDKDKAKKILKELSKESNELSIKIDSGVINTMVDYEPMFDVSEPYDDVVAEFASNKGKYTQG